MIEPTGTPERRDERVTEESDARLTRALQRLDEAIDAIEKANNPDTLMMRELLIASGEAVQVAVEEACLTTLDQKNTNALMVASHNEFVAWFGKLRRAKDEGQF